MPSGVGSHSPYAPGGGADGVSAAAAFAGDSVAGARDGDADGAGAGAGGGAHAASTSAAQAIARVAIATGRRAVDRSSMWEG
jgi:hypothetical protein